MTDSKAVFKAREIIEANLHRTYDSHVDATIEAFIDVRLKVHTGKITSARKLAARVLNELIFRIPDFYPM